ncbi:MAG: peptidylprolyl isomerase [Myxococcaceae bacterium]
MKARHLLPLVLLSLPALADGKFMKAAMEKKDLWATMETTKGTIVLHLFSKDAPKTVANFVGLATGEKEWTDPNSGQKQSNKPMYDGTIFHRVIPNFMIQGGDPAGTGRGSPGYTFEDEFESGRKFDKVGILAMANRGPATNGSQFFITTSTPQHLNGKHTIFGEVVTGYDVVEAIGNADKGPGDRPNVDIKIVKLTITDKAPAAKPATAPAPKGAK